MRTVIRAIAFDVMDTLLRDPFREALRAATGRSLEELAASRDPSAYPAFERGELDEADYWAAYGRAGIDVDPAAFHRVRRAGTHWLPGMRELVADLEGVVVRATASNYPHWIDELAQTHLDRGFEHILASCHLGVRKPDHGFFERLVARIGHTPDEVLFLDDRASNVEAAASFGLRAHRFTDALSARAWIASQGVAVSTGEGDPGAAHRAG